MLGEFDFLGGFWRWGGEVGLGSGVWVREEGGVSVLGFVRVFFQEDAVVGVSLPHISCHPSPPTPPTSHPTSLPFPLAFFSNLPSSPQTSNNHPP